MKKIVIQKVNDKFPSRIKKGWALKEAFSEKTIEITNHKSFLSKYLYAFNFNLILNNSAFSEGCFYGLSHHQFINLIRVTKQDPTSINLQALVINFDDLFGKSFTYKGYLNYLPRFRYDEPSRILLTLSKLESRDSKTQFIKMHPFIKSVWVSPGRLSIQQPSIYDYFYFFYIQNGLINYPIAEEVAIERILFQEINHMILNFNNLQINFGQNQYLYSPRHEFDLLYERQRAHLKSIEISDERFVASTEDLRVYISKKDSICIVEISNLFIHPVELELHDHRIRRIITYNEAKVSDDSILLNGFGYILIELEYINTKGGNFYEI
jgi:hypothetical protein